jgi:hypothetical protein
MLEAVFDRLELRGHAISALKGALDDSLVERARVALRAGMTPEQVVSAAVDGHGDVFTYWGHDSERLVPIVEDFRRLASGPSAEHRLLGEAGVRLYTERLDRARQRERHERVYGL